jgi:hypothetical protein
MTKDPLRRRPRLGEIARGGVEGVLALKGAWANTQASASDPLPPGSYKCLAAEGRLFNSQSNSTPGYKLVLQVLDGPHAGRRLWHDLWLTPDALARTKYELGELGITDLDQLEEPLPVGRIVEVVVARRLGDDGLPFNKVRSIKAISPAAPVDDFAPPPEAGTAPVPSTNGAMGG